MSWLPLRVWKNPHRLIMVETFGLSALASIKPSRGFGIYKVIRLQRSGIDTIKYHT